MDVIIYCIGAIITYILFWLFRKWSDMDEFLDWIISLIMSLAFPVGLLVLAVMFFVEIDHRGKSKPKWL